MKTFTKVVLAAAISVASIGASAAPGDISFDIRDRLEGVYSNFGSSFVGDTGALTEYGQLLYIIDNQRDARDVNGQLTLHFDDNNHIQVNTPVSSIDGFNVADIDKAVSTFVTAVNSDLFGYGGTQGQVAGHAGNSGYSNANLDGNPATGVPTNGIIGDQLEYTVDLVAAYNTVLDGSDAELAGQTELDTFNTHFLGEDGFQVAFNNSVDVLSDVNSALGTGNSDAEKFAALELGAINSVVYGDDGVTVTSTYGGNQFGGSNSTDSGTGSQLIRGEVISGGEAYALFLSQMNDADTAFEYNALTVDASVTDENG